MVPEPPSKMSLPLVMTTVDVVVLPQPAAVTSHTPSKLLPPPPPPPPPPPLFRAARRGSSASGLGLLRRAGVSTERGDSRVPDSDFSSLPMLPPALPCANAGLAPTATMHEMQSKAILIARRTAFRIMACFQ